MRIEEYHQGNSRNMRVCFPLALCFLLMAGCDSNTTQPDTQTLQLTISGTFEAPASFVIVNRIAVLFDGTTAAMKTCSAAEAHLCSVTASGSAERGTHSVDFQLVRQFCNFLPCSGKQTYNLVGNVTVSNSSGVVQQIPLSKQTVTLNDGDKLTYQINVNP